MAPTLPSFPPLLGYLPREHLAQGGQSSVYRALNPKTDHLAAIKVVPLQLNAGEQAAAVQAKAKQLVREMRIHETLQHRNVLRLFGGETREECEVQQGMQRRQWPAGLYMVLDLADGGDLFDKITPDVGVDEDIAHLYFKQLISGLKYLNHHGICHRDVKPENCLLDGHGNLKISDFGLATVFKYKGQERLLKDRCGSPPYAAPELARPQPYAAEPIDVWSAGVVLFALLFGNTPWDEPTPSSPEFAAYLSGSFVRDEPWSRLVSSSGQRSAVGEFLLGLLTVEPEKRPKLAEVERGEWYRQANPLIDPATGLVADPHQLLQRLLATLHAHEHIGPPAEEFEDLMAIADMSVSSQQPPAATQAALSQAYSQRGLDPQQSFRSSLQLYVCLSLHRPLFALPLFGGNNVGLSNMSEFTDALHYFQSRLSMAPTQRTNPNLTRFFTKEPLPVLISCLRKALDSLALPAPASSRDGKAWELLYSSVSPSSSSSASSPSPAPPTREDIETASLGTLLARFRIRSIDKRKQRLWVGLHISKSVLPPDPSARALPSQSQGGMDLDLDSDEEDDMPRGAQQEQEEKGEEGFDVVCWKRDADPLELKRVWKEVISRLPPGVVLAT
ncbi:hypothetical protein JCM10213_000553 [Rhodosporidiobolus nylandii]